MSSKSQITFGKSQICDAKPKVCDAKIFYINLDERKDRRKHIEKLLFDMPEAERVAGIIDERGGYFGCVRSHIFCLQLALLRKYDSVIILEDDFIYKGLEKLNDMEIPKEYDMLLLSNLVRKTDTEKYDDNFDRVYKAQWTSGYLVHHKFYQKLIDTFNESLEALDKKYCRDNYLDIYWNRIFKDHLILKHKKMIGSQLPEDFSDIHNKVIKRKN